GIDADQIVDDRARHLVAQRGLVDALVEADGVGVVVVLVGFGDLIVDVLDIDGDVFAGVRERHDGLDGAVAVQYDPDRLQPLSAALAGREEDAQLLAFFERALAAARAEHAGDRLDLLGGRGELALQDRADRFALLGRDRALVPGIAAGRLI